MSPTNHDPQHPTAGERFWRVLRNLGPGLPIILAVLVSLFTPLDMVWGVVIGIVVAVFMGDRLRRSRKQA